MSDVISTEATAIVDGQQDLFTGEVVETPAEEAEVTVDTVIGELADTVYGTAETVTPYKVANIVNGAFKVLGVAKVIPPQMMYNYSRNGLLVKGEKGLKALTKEQTVAFVTKYVNKYL